MKTNSIGIWYLGGLLLMLGLEASVCHASNVPPCIPTTNWYDAWNCSSGSISNVGVVTPTHATIGVGESASASISGTTFNDGSKSRTGHNDCGDSWTDGPYSYGYSATNWFEPEIPGTFSSCGNYSFTAEVEGISNDSDCPGTVGPQSPGTFTVTVVAAEVKLVTFTTDHGVLTDYNSDYAGNGGTVYSPRGWTKSPAVNNPVTHSQGVHVGVTVVISVCPSGLTYDLEGTSASSALTFHKTGNTSTGSDQSITLTSDAALPAKVDILNDSIDWKVTVDSKQFDAGTSGPHKVYVLWGTPFGSWTATQKRINWICTTAKGATSIDAAEGKLHDELVNYFDLMHNCFPNPWLVLDGGTGYDCQSLSACQGLASQLLGVSATLNYAYPSTDADCSSLETRTCPGGVHGYEQLFIHDGGWNQYDACCIVNSKWYPGGLNAGPYTSALEVIRNWLGASGPYQAWVYSGNNECTNPGPDPVPSP